MAEVARRLALSGWTAVKVDVQHTADEAAFLHEIHDAIRQTGLKLPLLDQAKDAIHRFGQFFRGTKVSVAGASLELKESMASWESAATSLKSLLGTLPDDDRRVMIAIDELPIFLTKLLNSNDGPIRVRAILDWLRSVRQATGRRMPWILCGSIGLDSFVAKHGWKARSMNFSQSQSMPSIHNKRLNSCGDWASSKHTAVRSPTHWRG